MIPKFGSKNQILFIYLFILLLFVIDRMDPEESQFFNYSTKINQLSFNEHICGLVSYSLI